MNISSIVVKTSRDRLQDVMNRITGIPGCEVHLYDQEGRIVVTIEEESSEGHMKSLKYIQDLPFVYSASLAYSYCGEERARPADRRDS